MNLSERLRVKISTEQSDAMDQISIKTGLNRSEITRAALYFFLERMKFYSPKGITELVENYTEHKVIGTPDPTGFPNPVRPVSNNFPSVFNLKPTDSQS